MSKRPSEMAIAARRWLSTASLSTASRSIPSMVAMASAQMPCWVCGWLARSRMLPLSNTGEAPGVGGGRPLPLISSVPPATTMSDMPDMMVEAAKLTVVMPEPQKRSSVTPLLRMS